MFAVAAWRWEYYGALCFQEGTEEECWTLAMDPSLEYCPSIPAYIEEVRVEELERRIEDGITGFFE